MKQITPVNKFAQLSLWLSAIILVLLPFHAFLSVWLSSLIGHYTLLRLWKELLLVPIVIFSLYSLFKDKSLRRNFFSSWLVRLILIYILLIAICAAAAYSSHAVTAKAMWYGVLVDLRFLVYFLSILILTVRSEWLNLRWQKILLLPALLVTVFAILQYLVLPYDFLKHFGYGNTTISPYETINHNLQHIRVASTLRGANPLGAYLILPISALSVMLFRRKDQRANILIFGAGLILALIFSFSRSAWIGAALAVAIAVWLSLKSLKAKKILGWSIAGALVVAAILLLALRNNLAFQNFIFHTDKASKIAATSDQGHAAAFKSSIKDIEHHPLGSGVGTAGPQSVYNNRPARIAENYYLQIGQEAGILGVALFIAILVLITKELFKSQTEPLALTLLVSLMGISFVGLLSHVWADDTLAYIWWGLAGICLAPAILTDRLKAKNGQKIKKPQTSRSIH